jgi:hypothetical protein
MILKPKWLTKIEPGHWASKGLVGSWIFNEGGGNLAYDTSGNGNHGSFINAAHSAAGRIGPTLELDGDDDYVNCGSASSLDNIVDQDSSGLSVVFWVKFASITSNDFIIGKDHTGSRRWHIFIESQAGQSIGFEKDISGLDVEAAADGIAVLNEWMQVAVTWDGTNQGSTGVKIYKNGIVQTLTHSGGGGTVPGSDAGLDLKFGDAAASMDGQIDHVLIYNRILNTGEINSLYLDPFQMFKGNL